MISDYSDHLIVQEVSPRDGLQIEPTWVETHDKIALIDQLSLAGFSRIEAGSFVSPKAIPALRDGELVFKGISRQPGVIYVALIPNLKGAQRALACSVDELNLVMSASQTHNLANMRMRCEDSLAAFGEIVQFVGDSPVRLNASSATTFGSEAARHEQLGESPSPPQSTTRNADARPFEQGEQRQALEQWLRQIPDDPAELLRRKFWYEQQRRQETPR